MIDYDGNAFWIAYMLTVLVVDLGVNALTHSIVWGAVAGGLVVLVATLVVALDSRP
jgi:hypothetical protein